MATYPDYLTFCEQLHREAQRLLGLCDEALQNVPSGKARMLLHQLDMGLLGLMSGSAKLKEVLYKAQESSEPNRYDLKTLEDFPHGPAPE